MIYGGEMIIISEQFYNKIQQELKYAEANLSTSIMLAVYKYNDHQMTEKEFTSELHSLAYQDVLYQDIAAQLQELSENSNPNILRGFADIPNLLDKMYAEWMDGDYSVNEEIRNMIEDYIHKQQQDKTQRKEEQNLNISAFERTKL